MQAGVAGALRNLSVNDEIAEEIATAGGIDALMELLMLNSRHWSRHWAGRLTLRFGNCLAWLRHFNPRWRSRRNLAHHYDLTYELFETFLDPRRQYSCA